MASSSVSSSSVSSSTANSISLEKIGEYDVTPTSAGVKIKGHRPDVVAIGSQLYLAYASQDTPSKQSEVNLIVLDKDVKQVSFSEGLFRGAAASMPTDIRTYSDGGSVFWYALETTSQGMHSCICNNKLNMAAYQADGNLVFSKTNIAMGCPIYFLMLNNCGTKAVTASWATDDPTPMYYNHNYCVAIRKNSSPQLQIFCLNSKGNQVADNKIDFSDIFGKDANLSQNAFVVIDGQPWIITGAEHGPPVGDGYVSVYAVQLSSNLSSVVGQPIEIVSSPNKEYKTRVVAARMYKNYLFITYVNRGKDGADSKGYLAVFDTTKKFAHVTQQVALDHSIADDHLPMAIIGDQAYVFHETEDKSLIGEIFAIK